MKKLPLIIATSLFFLLFSCSFAQTRGGAQPNEMKTIKIASSATEFHALHKDAAALKSKQKSILKVGDFFCVDLQIGNLTQKWDAQLSDLGVVHIVDAQNFEGKTIAPEMPNLNSWKFLAQKAGKCILYFVLPSPSGEKEDEHIVTYEIEVLEKK